MMDNLWATSQLEDLLSSNRCPTKEERGYTKHVIDNFDQKLHGVRENISQLKSQLQLLCDQETSLVDSISKYNNILSPIRRLPANVVQQIFMACLQTDRNPTMSNKEAPVLLTHISNDLRRIALSTKALWAAIHIPIASMFLSRDEYETRMAKRADGVKEWLFRRSGNSSLSISLYAGAECMGDKPYIRNMVDIIISCSSRWRNVSFCCDLTNLAKVAALTESDVPLIQSFSVIQTLGFGLPPHSWDTCGVLRVKCLKSLTMSKFGSISSYPVKWSNLTHLTYRIILDLPAARTLGQLLRETISLVSCDITIKLRESEVAPDFGIISLPSLKILTINEAIEMKGSNDFISAIDAPALEALSYNMDTDTKDMMDSISKSDAVLSLLTESPNVKELSLGLEVVEEETLIDICQQCPLLNILHIRHLPDSPDDFLGIFALDDVTICNSPRLQYFRCDSKISVSLKTLHEFIMRKDGSTPGLSRWKNVKMELGYCQGLECVEQFEALTVQMAAAGLNINLTCPKIHQASYSLFDGIDDRPDTDWAPSRFRKQILF